MSEIRPALTREQWADYLAGEDPVVGELYIRSRPGEPGMIVDGTVWPADLLPIAALCLHGRISWDMVDALRNAASWASLSVGDLEQNDRDAATTLALAGLLESLLPPR